MKYLVKLQETICYEQEVEAESESEAIELANEYGWHDYEVDSNSEVEVEEIPTKYKVVIRGDFCDGVIAEFEFDTEEEAENAKRWLSVEVEEVEDDD